MTYKKICEIKILFKYIFTISLYKNKVKHILLFIFAILGFIQNLEHGMPVCIRGMGLKKENIGLY